MEICGDAKVYIPDLPGCDDCESFQDQLNQLTEAVAGKQDTLTAGDGISLNNNTVSFNIETVPDMQGASAGNAGRHGLVPEPQMGDQNKVLHGDGSWRTVPQSLTAGDGIEISNNTISALRNPTNTYTKAEVDALIADVEHVSMVEVATLPATGEANIIYLVPRTGGTGKEMWIYSNGEWHDLGPTAVDLSNYYTKTQVDGLLDGKVNKVSGMGLSQNSYTTAEKNKLSALPTATALNTALSNKQDKLTFDNTPTDGSSNPVTSGGVYDRFALSDTNLAPILNNTFAADLPKNSYVIYNGALHRLVTDVSAGDTPVVGGNIERYVGFANQARAAVISSNMSAQHMSIKFTGSTLDFSTAQGMQTLYAQIRSQLADVRGAGEQNEVFVHGLVNNNGSIYIFRACVVNDLYGVIDMLNYFDPAEQTKRWFIGTLFSGTWSVFTPQISRVT